MRRTKPLITAIGLAFALAVGMPASADIPEPQITDAAGDANFLNAQGNTNAEPASGPDTSAVYNEAGADIRSISMYTRYTKVRMLNTDGTVEMIDYRPKALEIDVTMTGPIKPAKASMIFRLQTTIEGCETWFQGWIRGAQAQATELERADIRKLTAGCPGGAATVFQGFQQIIDGNVMSLIYPFEAGAFTGQMAGFITSGSQINPLGTFTNNANYPHIRVSVNGGTLTAPTIDQTNRPTPFTVSSDVPADIICNDSPEHPECTAS
jgi:hypothetical protein